MLIAVIACKGVPDFIDEDWTPVGSQAVVFRVVEDDFQEWRAPWLSRGMAIVDADLDGEPELAVGAPYWWPDDYDPDTDNGVYIVKPHLVTVGDGEYAALPGVSHATLKGRPGSLGFGNFISAQGDVNGNGSPEIDIGHFSIDLPVSGTIQVHDNLAWSFADWDEEGSSGFPTVDCGDFDQDGNDDYCNASTGMIRGRLDFETDWFDRDFAFGGEYMHTGQLRDQPTVSLISGSDRVAGDRGQVIIAHTFVPDGPSEDYPMIRITGEEPGDRIANWIGVGDLDMDGDEDLYIGSILADEGRGRGYLWLDTEQSGDVAEAPVVFEGRHPLDAMGRVSAIADFDGDGWNDLALGISTHPSLQAGRPGRVAIFRGPFEPGRYDESDAAVVWYGSERPGDQFGQTLVAADFDGDGAAELAVGAPGDSEIQMNGGAVYYLADPLP